VESCRVSENPNGVLLPILKAVRLNRYEDDLPENACPNDGGVYAVLVDA
jgi:hypothetical protein